MRRPRALVTSVAVVGLCVLAGCSSDDTSGNSDETSVDSVVTSKEEAATSHLVECDDPTCAGDLSVLGLREPGRGRMRSQSQPWTGATSMAAFSYTPRRLAAADPSSSV